MRELLKTPREVLDDIPRKPDAVGISEDAAAEANSLARAAAIVGKTH